MGKRKLDITEVVGILILSLLVSFIAGYAVTLKEGVEQGIKICFFAFCIGFGGTLIGMWWLYLGYNSSKKISRMVT